MPLEELGQTKSKDSQGKEMKYLLAFLLILLPSTAFAMGLPDKIKVICELGTSHDSGGNLGGPINLGNYDDMNCNIFTMDMEFVQPKYIYFGCDMLNCSKFNPADYLVSRDYKCEVIEGSGIIFDGTRFMYHCVVDP